MHDNFGMYKTKAEKERIVRLKNLEKARAARAILLKKLREKEKARLHALEKARRVRLMQLEQARKEERRKLRIQERNRKRREAKRKTKKFLHDNFGMYKTKAEKERESRLRALEKARQVRHEMALERRRKQELKIRLEQERKEQERIREQEIKQHRLEALEKARQVRHEQALERKRLEEEAKQRRLEALEKARQVRHEQALERKRLEEEKLLEEQRRKQLAQLEKQRIEQQRLANLEKARQARSRNLRKQRRKQARQKLEKAVKKELTNFKKNSKKFLHNNFGMYKTKKEIEKLARLKALEKARKVRHEQALERKRLEELRLLEEQRIREEARLEKERIEQQRLANLEKARQVRHERALEKKRLEQEAEQRRLDALERAREARHEKVLEKKRLEEERLLQIELRKQEKQREKELKEQQRLANLEKARQARIQKLKEKEARKRRAELKRKLRRFMHDNFGMYKTKKELERISRLEALEKARKVKAKHEKLHLPLIAYIEEDLHKGIPKKKIIKQLRRYGWRLTTIEDAFKAIKKAEKKHEVKEKKVIKIPKDLIKFIKHDLGKGIEKSLIKKQLLRYGWHKDLIDKAFVKIELEEEKTHLEIEKKHREELKKIPPEVIEYVKRDLGKGLDKSLIKKQLKRYGWHEDLVEKVFRRIGPIKKKHLRIKKPRKLKRLPLEVMDYIKKDIGKGLDRRLIKKQLLKYGWEKDLVEKGFKEIELEVKKKHTELKKKHLEEVKKIPSELLDYIKKDLGRGLEKALIKKQLKKHGWHKDQIDRAFRKIKLDEEQHPKKKVPKEIIEYIKQGLSKGVAKGKIEKQLLRYGWHKDVVEEAFRRVI